MRLRISQSKSTIRVDSCDRFIWFIVIKRVFAVRNYFRHNTVRNIINTDLRRLIFVLFDRA